MTIKQESAPLSKEYSIIEDSSKATIQKKPLSKKKIPLTEMLHSFDSRFLAVFNDSQVLVFFLIMETEMLPSFDSGFLAVFNDLQLLVFFLIMESELAAIMLLLIVFF
nr:hypothetical protein [Tanacetum cinerariifolium]